MEDEADPRGVILLAETARTWNHRREMTADWLHSRAIFLVVQLEPKTSLQLNGRNFEIARLRPLVGFRRLAVTDEVCLFLALVPDLG